MLEERDLGVVKCAADIPLWKRICVIEPKFAEDGGGALIKYMRASKSGERDKNGLKLKEVFKEQLDGRRNLIHHDFVRSATA